MNSKAPHPGSDAARRASARARIAAAAREIAADGAAPGPAAGPASRPQRTNKPRSATSTAAPPSLDSRLSGSGAGVVPPPPPPPPAPPSYEPASLQAPPRPPHSGSSRPYESTPVGESKADAAFILGIISLFLNVFYVPGILAIVWGGRERRENRRARAGFVCGIIGTVVAGLATIVLGLAVVGANTVVDDRLLRADFRTGRGPFVTGVTPEINYDVVDGTYRIQSRTSEPGLATSLANFARTAYAVDMSADVVSVTGDGVFGVGCQSNTDEAYLLLAGVDGGLALGRKDADRGPSNHTQILATNEEIRVPATNVRLTLSCRSSLGGSAVTLRGYVDGREVIRGRDADGLDGFRQGVLAFDSSMAGAEVRFSRADAVVTGTD